MTEREIAERLAAIERDVEQCIRTVRGMKETIEGVRAQTTEASSQPAEPR